MNIVRDHLVLPQREESKTTDANMGSKTPPFATAQNAMEASHNINNNNTNVPYQSYRKPLKRNNPVGASAPFPKIPPFAATNRLSGPPDGSASASNLRLSSNSGAPMSKKSKEDSESPVESAKASAECTESNQVFYERDKSRVPSGLGRAVFKKPFDCKMVLKQRSPSKFLPQPPAVIEGLNKSQSDVGSRSLSKEESLSDWLNPRANRNEVMDSGKPSNDFRPGGDGVNNTDPPKIPGLSGGNGSINNLREPWKSSDPGSTKGSNDASREGSDSRPGGSVKGRDPVRGTRWGDNDDSSRKDEMKKSGWLDGGGAAYAKQFEGKPGFGPSRGRGNMREQEMQNHPGNVRQNSGGGSYNDYNQRNQQNSHQNWRQKDRHEDNNRNWRPHGDKWNNDRGGPDVGNPNWRHSSRNQSAWTAPPGPRGPLDSNDRFNRPSPQNERFAQFEQKWNTGRTQGSNSKNDAFSQLQGSASEQNFNPNNYNSNYADSDDGKEIIVGQHMSSVKDREAFQKDIPPTLSNQQQMPSFNNPIPHGNPSFSSFPQQMPPPNFPGPTNFLTGNSNPGINNFISKTAFNAPASVGLANTSAGQNFPNTNMNFSSQPKSMFIPGLPVSSTQAYDWASNSLTSNMNPGSIATSSAIFNNGRLNSDASSSAPVSNFYTGYQNSNVSMPSTVVTPSVAPVVSMTGQAHASQASNYTSEQLQDYQKQWDDYKVKWEKYQLELAEYNKKMQEVNASSGTISQTPQQSFSVPSSTMPVASVAPSPVVQQPAALQQMAPALGAVPNLGASGQLNLQAAAAAAVLQPNLTPSLGSNLLLNQPGPATATANPYQQTAAAQAMMTTMQQPAASAFNYAQFYPNANPTTATLQQAAGLMSMTAPTYPGAAVNFAAAQIPSFYPAAGASVAAATNPLGIINPIAAPAGTGAPM